MRHESGNTTPKDVCPKDVTAGMLRRLHYGEEPGRGFTQDTLYEHVSVCEQCQGGMSLIARSDERLKAEYEAFRNRLAEVAKRAESSRSRDEEEFMAHHARAEEMRRNMMQQIPNLPEEAELPVELTVADTKRMLADLRRGRVASEDVIQRVVDTSNRVIGMTNGVARQMMVESLAMWCRLALRELPDRQRLMSALPPFAAQQPSFSVHPKEHVYPLDAKEALPIALAMATDAEVLSRAREPIMGVKPGVPPQLVVDQRAYMRAVAGGQGA